MVSVQVLHKSSRPGGEICMSHSLQLRRNSLASGRSLPEENPCIHIRLELSWNMITSRLLGVHPTTELSLDYLAFTCHPIAGPATQLLVFTQLHFFRTILLSSLLLALLFQLLGFHPTAELSPEKWVSPGTRGLLSQL